MGVKSRYRVVLFPRWQYHPKFGRFWRGTNRLGLLAERVFGFGKIAANRGGLQDGYFIGGNAKIMLRPGRPAEHPRVQFGDIKIDLQNPPFAPECFYQGGKSCL